MDIVIQIGKTVKYTELTSNDIEKRKNAIIQIEALIFDEDFPVKTGRELFVMECRRKVQRKYKDNANAILDGLLRWTYLSPEEKNEYETKVQRISNNVYQTLSTAKPKIFSSFFRSYYYSKYHKTLSRVDLNTLINSSTNPDLIEGKLLYEKYKEQFWKFTFQKEVKEKSKSLYYSLSHLYLSNSDGWTEEDQLAFKTGQKIISQYIQMDKSILYYDDFSSPFALFFLDILGQPNQPKDLKELTTLWQLLDNVQKQEYILESYSITRYINDNTQP